MIGTVACTSLDKESRMSRGDTERGEEVSFPFSSIHTHLESAVPVPFRDCGSPFRVCGCTISQAVSGRNEEIGVGQQSRQASTGPSIDGRCEVPSSDDLVQSRGVFETFAPDDNRALVAQRES